MKKCMNFKWLKTGLMMVLIMQLAIVSVFAATPEGAIDNMLQKKCDPPIITSSFSNGNDKTDISGTGNPGYNVNMILLDGTVKTEKVGNDGTWKFTGIENSNKGANLLIYQSHKGKLDSEYGLVNDLITIGNEKFRLTGKENIYEVLNMNGHSKNPIEYIFDEDDSIKKDHILNGDEVRFGSEFFDRLDTTYPGYYWRGEGESRIEIMYINDIPTVTDKYGNVIIDAVNFPDDIFRQYIKDNSDTNHDEKLNKEEIVVVTNINVSNLGITSLLGIGMFKNLGELIVSDNSILTSISVSKNTKLETLDISKTGITDIDLGNNTTLVSFAAGSAQLKSIDISKNVDLEILRLGTNNLTSIDVSNNTKLTNLQVHSNQLTSIDISKNIALDYFTCNGNQLTLLDVSKNTALTYLNAGTNSLTSLDVNKNTALTTLRCNGCQLNSLDVSNNITLEELYAQDNHITAIDISMTAIITQAGSRLQNNGMTSLKINAAQDAANIGKSSSYHKAGNPDLVVTIV